MTGNYKSELVTVKADFVSYTSNIWELRGTVLHSSWCVSGGKGGKQNILLFYLCLCPSERLLESSGYLPKTPPVWHLQWRQT